MRKAALLALATFSIPYAHAGDDPVQICYAVADSEIPGSASAGPDRLLRLRADGSGLSLVGQTGTFFMEAIALNRAQNRLYAMNGSTLGVVDTAVAGFDVVGSSSVCESPNGLVGLDDLDALGWNPANGQLWAVQRNGGPASSVTQTGEFLVQIDPATGEPTDGTCVELTGTGPGIGPDTDIDALTFAPDGRVLATANSGSGRSNRLVSVDIDTGIMTDIGPTVINDVEGLHFDELDHLLGTTGVSSQEPNSLVLVNPQTGEAALIGESRLLEVALEGGSFTSDIEAISCRLEPPDVIENPSVDIEKATNGEDADTPTGPAVGVGETVTWTYVVTNDGDVDLFDLVVSDNQEGTICSIPTLAPGASETCTATGTAVEGQYANIASVVGNTDAGQAVSDSDPSHYIASVVVNPGNPAVDIEKSTNGQDADLPPGPGLDVGEKVIWSYDVTNTGDVLLIDLTVVDDREGQVCTIAELAPGASTQCTLTSVAAEGQYDNTGSVTASTEGGTTVTDSDPSHYTARVVVIPGNPAIDVEKATNGFDADDAPGPDLEAGTTVTWTYVVTNVGDEVLNNVTVTDDLEGAVCQFETLAVDESRTCELTGIAELGQYENVATAMGTGASGTDVDDEDPSHYFGAIIIGPGSPGIDLEKLTNGVDADIGPGPRVEIGSTVQWTYIVTNIGDLLLNDVTIVDDIEGSVCTIRELPVGAQRRCNITGSAIGGEYENLGSVTARATNGQTVGDTDPSHYIAAILTGGDPAIDIEKATNGVDADIGPGPILDPGDDVVWTYVVTNIGDVVLINIQVTDDQEGGVCVIPQLDPGEGATCRLEGIAQPFPYANLATATGRDGRGNSVSDVDPSHYGTTVDVGGPLPPGGQPIPAPVDARWALLLLILATMFVARRWLREGTRL